METERKRILVVIEKASRGIAQKLKKELSDTAQIFSANNNVKVKVK